MSRIQALAFDLDGTLYYGSKAVEGAVEAVGALYAAGYHIYYFTNNSARTKVQIVQKLNALGFDASLATTYTASDACRRYLKERDICEVFLIGSHDFENELKADRVRIVEPTKAEAVVVGLDFDLSYDKIAGALQAIGAGAELIVANLDSSYPVENGLRMPGCGAMVGSVVGSTGKEPDFITGKPNTYMLELLCSDWNHRYSEICVVGDSVESDMEMSTRFKCSGILFDHYDKYTGTEFTRVRDLQDIINIINRDAL
jgi:HAD superfamily hydrolase (TIGR01450 family)